MAGWCSAPGALWHCLSGGLLSEKVTRPHVRALRPISIPAVPVSEGIEIRQECHFARSLVRALGKLPGGIGRCCWKASVIWGGSSTLTVSHLGR